MLIAQLGELCAPWPAESLLAALRGMLVYVLPVRYDNRNLLSTSKTSKRLVRLRRTPDCQKQFN